MIGDPVRVEFNNDLAFITINNPPVNATSQAVRAGLVEALSKVEASNAKAAILRCEGKTFIAGGDINEFDKPPVEPHLPDLCNAIEKTPIPWIAAMHGTVLGGGFEIALACAYRIAVVGSRFGLPEVNIGLTPGAGGTQRLPRLAGVELAVDMAAGGRIYSAEEMLSAKVIDSIVENTDLAAIAFARSDQPRRLPISQRSIEHPGAIWFDEKRAALTRKAKGQHSPLKVLDAIEWACTTDFPEGQKREREQFLKLKDSNQSKALRHAFFAERQAAKPEIIKGIEPLEINRIAIIGGGLMGAGIATACLSADYQVHVLERDQEASVAAIERVKSNILGAVKRGKTSQAKADSQLAKLSAGSDYQTASSCDLAIEAVFEDLKVKQETFQKLSAVMRENAILATNTSYIDPLAVFEGIGNQARCLGLHFFSPAHIMKLVEVVQTPHTCRQVLATGFALSTKLKKFPVLSGICDGFIGNRILAAYRRQADYLLADGALPHQVDAAMRDFGMPMGPYELQDLTGLQISWANRKRQAAARDPNERYVTIGDQLCELERLGQRSGKGWYRYEEGSRRPIQDNLVTELILSYSKSEGIERQSYSADDIRDRLIATMANEGALIVEEGIAQSTDDVDVVKMHGYGFPRWRGGPMHYVQSQDLSRIAKVMQDVAAQSPHSWTISRMLERQAQNRKL